jgi:hypothetical protein
VPTCITSDAEGWCSDQCGIEAGRTLRPEPPSSSLPFDCPTKTQTEAQGGRLPNHKRGQRHAVRQTYLTFHSWWFEDCESSDLTFRCPHILVEGSTPQTVHVCWTLHRVTVAQHMWNIGQATTAFPPPSRLAVATASHLSGHLQMVTQPHTVA